MIKRYSLFAMIAAAAVFLAACSSAGKAEEEAKTQTAKASSAEKENAAPSETEEKESTTPSETKAKESAAPSLSPEPVITKEADVPQSYTQISQDTAKEMMKKDDGHVIVDVRTWAEYNAGHIPEAVCIPNESIFNDPPKELPDLDQVILIYCRSGNRSKQAAEKLFNMGYTNIYEFGGIIYWTGDVVTDAPDDRTADEKAIWTALNLPVSVRYDRMWEYGDFAESTDPAFIRDLVDAVIALDVGEETDIQTDDFTDILTFSFENGTEVCLEFENQYWVTEDQIRYNVE